MESPLGQVHRTAGRRSGIRQPRRPAFPYWRSQRTRLDGRDDDDDDPPPFPACAMPPNWRPSPDPATAALPIPEEPVGDDLKGRIAECLLASA
jgi:hypothetical protein